MPTIWIIALLVGPAEITFTGSVFKTLFDIDAVGNDFILYNTYTCGKGGQSVPVSAGGPTVRVKKLSVN